LNFFKESLDSSFTGTLKDEVELLAREFDYIDAATV